MGTLRKEFPIKYLENNLVFNNKTGDVYAYYEWMPYNYSCISEDKALAVADNIGKLLVSARSKKMHLLLVNTEESIHETIARSKKLVKGDLKDTAWRMLDGVELFLEDVHGKNEIEVRFYIGFLLSGGEYELSGRREKSGGKIFSQGIRGFFRNVNETLFGDYVRMDKEEVERYVRLEQMLRGRIGKIFRLRRAEPKDIAYIIQHLNGHQGESYDYYSYNPERIVEDDKVGVKKYDVIRLEDSKLENHERSLNIIGEERTEKVAYLALSRMTGENEFPYYSEVLYYQQTRFQFPVDVSVKIEVVENKSALKKLRDKKAELKDLDENAWDSGNESTNAVYEAAGDVKSLEAVLDKTRENMYKISYILRVAGKDDEELASRVMEVKDFYEQYKMVIQRPLCDQAGLHEEFYPSVDRYMDDYIQYVRLDFLEGIGFGAVQRLGEKEGIYSAHMVNGEKSVYIQPWIAAQGVSGSVTNALARAFIGSLGGGKSVAMNLQAIWTVLFGGRSLIIDPKGERGEWGKSFPFLGNHLNLIDVVPGEENRGLFDPFCIMENVKDAEKLALDVLIMMTGITIRDSERFPVLAEHVNKVAMYQGKPKGMKCVIDELRNTDTEISRAIAVHIESFSDLAISSLIFGDGTQKRSLDISRELNVLLVQDLVLPETGTLPENYSLTELLSTVILLVISTFSLRFINQYKGVFKSVTLDEAWAWLQVAQGKALAQRLIREGRHMNAGIDFGTQNCDDLLDEKMKNNIGMKFAFRSTDIREIEKTLEFMGLEFTESNVDILRNLENGECLFADIYGHCGVIKFDFVFVEFERGLNTSPPERELDI